MAVCFSFPRKKCRKMWLATSVFFYAKQKQKKTFLVLWTKNEINEAVQCVAQFSYTLVCNRYIFSSLRWKFLRFLLEIAHLLAFNMYKDERLDRRIFKIMPFSRKLESCPVCVHLAQFSYIDKTTFSRENASSKLMCQPLCCRLIVFSLRFVNRNRLSDQCLVYKAKGYLVG